MKALGLLLVAGLLVVGWIYRDKLQSVPAAVGTILPSIASATPHPAPAAQAQVMARYPALRLPDSSLNKKFVALYKEAQTGNRELLSRPDWPFELVEKAVAALGGAPLTRSATTAAAPQSRTTKSVVMYTTSHCPYCKQAKQYFTSKGVSYREVNIETSLGKSEFRQKGGNGVPLILVGSSKVSGFNAAELDRLLF